jgi:uncharacterized membrane protein
MKINMMKYRQGAFSFLALWTVTAILTVWVVMLFSAPVWAKPKGSYGTTNMAGERELRKKPVVKRWDTIGHTYKENSHIYIARKKRPSPETAEGLERKWKNYQDLSPDEKARLKRKRKQWEALPPEKKKVLRQRMKQLKSLSPGDRELFRQRFHQWKKLSPEERQGIRQDLDRWDRLPPQERERIRRRFLNK